MSDVRVLPRLLVTFTAFDVPDEIQAKVMRLLSPYDPGIYERAESRSGGSSSGGCCPACAADEYDYSGCHDFLCRCHDAEPSNSGEQR
jgi:hypothetical protein